MKSKIIKAPILNPMLPFSEDEKEQGLSERQSHTYVSFYRRLLPIIDGLMWESEDKKIWYIFSKDTKAEGYRVSVFDAKGAIRHCSRPSIAELFREEQFPFDGQAMVAVKKGES